MAMFRIVRKSTLDALHADRAALGDARDQLERAKTEAETATDSAIRAEVAAEDLLTQTAQAYADRIKAERERDQTVAQRERDKAETNRQLAELREDLMGLRDAAADVETGETRRAALAYRLLRDLYADAYKEGLLPQRPFDLLAVVLDFDTADQKTPTPTA